MNKNKKNSITDWNIAEAFESLFDEILIPETKKEADEIMSEAGIDANKWNDEMYTMIQKLLRESPLNWRNVTNVDISNIVKELESIPKHINKTRKELWDLIEKILDELYSSMHKVPVAYRNLEEVTEEDLASLLQELEYQLQLEKKMDVE